MTKSLIIAEKPSVAQDIVRALTPSAGKFEKHDEYFESEQYLVTSAVGHLLEIKAPEEFDVKRGKWSFAHLPVIPPHFDLAPLDKTKGRLNAIVKLVKRKDVSELINACDAGREGELIFRLIQQHAKSKQPVKRLWLQSMTPAAIRDGFEHLRSDKELRGLASLSVQLFVCLCNDIVSITKPTRYFVNAMSMFPTRKINDANTNASVACNNSIGARLICWQQRNR
jgi:DNA topoisomerase-3